MKKISVAESDLLIDPDFEENSIYTLFYDIDDLTGGWMLFYGDLTLTEVELTDNWDETGLEVLARIEALIDDPTLPRERVTPRDVDKVNYQLEGWGCQLVEDVD